MLRIIASATVLFLSVCIPLQADSLNIYGGSTPKLQYVLDGKAGGPATRVVEHLMQNAGIAYNIRVSNWARAHKQYSEDPQSLMFSIVRTPAREKQYRWLASLGMVDLHIGRKSTRTELNPKSFDDLKGYSIGAVRNAYTHRLLENQGFKLNEDFFVVATPSELMQLIQHDKLDFVFYEPTITPATASLFNLPEDYLTPVPIRFEHRYEIYLVGNPGMDSSLADNIIQTHQRLLQHSPRYQQLLADVLPDSREHRSRD